MISLTVPSGVPGADTSPEGKTHDNRLDTIAFSQMGQAEQRQWLREIITRLDRANQLVLAPDKAAQQKARYAVLLQQVAQGRQVSPAEAEQFLLRTDRQEKAAIERLARKFRIQVYQTFRQRRGTFTRRRVAWSRVHAQWKSAGGSFEEQDRLIDWLQASLRVSLPDSVGPLPADPEFKVVWPVTEGIVSDGRKLPITSKAPIVSLMPQPDSHDRTRVATAPPPIAQPDSGAPGLKPSARFASTPRVRRETPERPVIGQIGGRSTMRRQPIVGVPPQTAPVAEAAVSTEALILSDPPGEMTSVSVNVEELAARTAGVNLAIRALKAELAQRGPWSANRIGPLIDQLDRLISRRDDLILFHDLLVEEQHGSAGMIDSPEALISQIAARIFEARTRVGGLDFEGSETDRDAELQQLDELSRKLATVASRE